MAEERDDMLRDMAKNRGLRLVKSRRRKPGGDFGLYGLVDPDTGKSVFGYADDALTASGDEIEAWLRKGLISEWKSSLAGEAGEAPPLKKKAQVGGTSGAEITNSAGSKKAAGPSSPSPSTISSKGKAESAERSLAAPAKPRPAFKGKPREEEQRIAVPAPAPPPEPRLKVRDARARDAAAIAALAREMGTEVSETEIAARLALLLTSNQAPLVAERQGEVVGCLTWSVTPALHRAQPFGRITMIIVARDLRRRGVGKKLLDEAATRMKERGCTLIEAISDIDIEAAHDFFRRLGFERTSYRFAREMKP